MTQARLLGGRYQVGELLGYGGMAEVHRGRDLRLGRDVAIKMLRTDLARDETFQLRFRREAHNAASLNHPAIVAVYDTGEERGPAGESLPYIVMEFVNGRTLKEVLASEGRLASRRALEITAEISGALDFSHRHAIIHRDIKPGNVMLTQTGQVKVMDFGIARALASGASTMTQTSAVIGTAQYLSPEQARGEAVDARSDVYATGCVLYELLCGQPPFVGDSPVSVAYQHVREEPHAPSETNQDVSPAIDAIVLKALSKNPVNRYQSAAEMRSDVLRAAAGRPVLAEPVLRDNAAPTQVVRAGTGAYRALPARGGDQQRRRTSGWAIAALTALAVLAVVALVAGIIVSAQPKKVTVPNLVNQPRDVADRLLAAQELGGEATPKTGTDCTINTVTSQTPPAGTSLPVGEKVTYKYCAGPGINKMPPVVGLPQAAAEDRLTSLGVRITVVAVDSDKPVGTVVESTPKVNADVAEGQEVTLKVSKGNLKPVPKVAGEGYTQDAAAAVLKAAGFLKYDVQERTVDKPDLDGKVIDQDPNAKTLANPSAVTITLYVGKYVDPNPSPAPTGSPSAGS